MTKVSFKLNSQLDAGELIDIYDNLDLLLKLFPPEIKTSVISKENGIIEETLHVSSLKKTITQQTKHQKISPQSFLLEIISGPAKGSVSKINFNQSKAGTEISVEINLKVSIKYKLFGSIIKNKLENLLTNILRRLDNLGSFISNKKYKVIFSNNYETITLSNNSSTNLIFHGWWLGDLPGMFLANVYKNLLIKDKTIIDVGSNICDSSIYFVQNGARKVIALEPFPINFRYAEQNIESNNLGGKIIPLLAGLSGKTSELRVNPDQLGVSVKMTESQNGMKIQQLSLDYLINEFDIKEGILKLNCEGCEYESILTPDSFTLQKFERILIQYHNGFKKLKTKLEDAGFVVSVTPHPSVELKGTILANLKKLN